MPHPTHTFTLPCGMRVVHMQSPTKVAYCGVVIAAGTRHEDASQYGLAHFCEHMLFKGTKRRRAWHILNRMEAVGGDLNAYTTKEETFVHTAFMKEHLARAAELVLDVVFNSTWPQHEIEKECEVIIDEIESYQDSPAELIYDEFENLLYAGHSLGHDILGTKERVRSFCHDDLVRFTQQHYSANRMVFFVMGDYETHSVERLLTRLSAMVLCKSGNTAVQIPPQRSVNAGKVHRIHRDTHQTHIMTGCQGFKAGDSRRTALYILNNIIGGPGMNSLLNVALRERRGLVYTVESALTSYTDTQTFSIYYGCDEADAERCQRIVRNELQRMADAPLSPKRFDAALRQIRGQIGVACDNFESYALDTAKYFLHYNRTETLEETFDRLAAVTPQQLQDVAAELFPQENMTTLIIGS